MADRDTPAHLTKTIPLNGGIQHDVEEMVQDAPTMTVQDNFRFRKQGEVEKTEPNKQVDNLPFSTSALAGLGTRSGKLFAVSAEGEAAEYDGTSDWNKATGKLQPNINETLYQGNPVPGAHGFCFGEGVSVGGVDYRIIAYEIREHNTTVSGGLPDVDVKVEVYNTTTGRILHQRRYADLSTPQIADCGSGPLVFCADASGDIKVIDFNELTLLLPVSAVSVGTAVACEADSSVYSQYSATTANRGAYRVGMSEDGGRGAAFRVAGDGIEGVLAYTATGAGAVRFTKLSTGGLATGTDTIISGSIAHVLGVAVSGATNLASLFFQTLTSNPAAPTYELRGVSINISLNPVAGTVHTLNGATTGHAVNGACAINPSSSDTFYAATIIGRDALEPLASAISEDAKLLTGSFDSSGFSGQGVLRNLRLASDVVYKDSSYMAMVVEQYQATEPATPTDGFTTHPVAIRGKTAVLLEKFPALDSYTVISAFDPGQSLAVNASSAEQYVATQTLRRDNDEYKYINRVLLQPEDLILHPNGLDALHQRTKGSWHAGEWRCSIYNVAPPTSLAIEQVGAGAVINTSIAAHYAGDVLVELSPLEQPEIVYFENSNGSKPARVGYELPPGANPDTTRVVQCIVGYTDRNGALHRSPPSTPLFVDGAVDQDTDGNDCWRDVGITLPLSGFGSRGEYFAEIYIGQASGPPQLAATWSFAVDSQATSQGTFRLMDSLAQPTSANPLRSSEVIYTEGDVLPSDAWPDFKDFVVTSNRLWGISRNVPGVVYYSKLFEPNIAPEFSAALIIDLGQNRQLNGIGAIDDKVVVFTDDEVFAIYDTGPDNTGANGDFIVDRLTTPFGCSSPESIVQIPDGLMFHSAVSGEIHLLSRDLQLHDVGKAIMDFTEQDGFDVVASVVYPAQHEVRFYIDVNSANEYGPDPDTGTGIKPRPARPKYTNVCTTTDCLVYNYHYQKWSRRTNDVAQFSVLYNNAPVIANAIGLVYFQTTDWTESELMKVESPWIRTGQFQSFGRIDEILIAGRYLSSWVDNGTGLEAGDIQVTLLYDYQGYAPQTDVYRFRANAGDLGTEEADRLQISVHPGQPKCQAFKVIVEEVATSPIEVSEPVYARGQGFSLSALDVRYTPKAGLGSKTLSAGRRK